MDETVPPQDRPSAEEVFERVERWRARGHLVAAEERVRGAAALRRRMLGQPDGEPGP